MAEAAVEENFLDQNVMKFFCHKCAIDIPRVLDDFTCPTCLGGFIEELEGGNRPADDGGDDWTSEDDYDMALLEEGEIPHPVDFLFQVNEALFGVGNVANMGNDRGRRRSSRPVNEATPLNIPPVFTRRRSRRGSRGRDDANHLIQDFILNLTGVGWGSGGQGRTGGPVRFLVGNPGDYAWGQGGLDAIVTQLLNQMDGAGPPPLDKEKIKEIPTIVISHIQAEAKMKCSVCWDEFEAGVSVRKLECEHFYHENCIIPWLELHATCPVCRKNLCEVAEGGNNPPNMPDLTNMLRRPSRWSFTPPPPSYASALGSNSTPRRSRPPPDNDMDFED